jgi:hypothetical protein
MHRKGLVAVAAGWLAFAAVAEPAAAGSFTYSFAPADYLFSTFVAISDAGQAVGSASGTGTDYVGLVWTNGTSVPYALNPPYSTAFSAINTSGLVGGDYGTGRNKSVGFFYTPSSGQLVPVPSPAFGEAYVAGLNASGQAILDDQTFKKAKAYFVSGSGFSKIKPPDHLLPQANGINDSGVVVGTACPSDGRYCRAFEVTGKTYADITPPGASSGGAAFITASGTIGGTYLDSPDVNHGFILSGGVYTTLDYPKAENSSPVGIGPQGEIVGNYTDAKGNAQGYIYVNGRFYSIAVSGYPNTQFNAVNASGTIAGTVHTAFSEGYYDTGFVATCPATAFPCTN